MTEDNTCSSHLIVWDFKNPDIADDYLSVTFEGICDRCSRRFQVTFHEPRYSAMELDENGEDIPEWKNYEMIGTEMQA